MCESRGVGQHHRRTFLRTIGAGSIAFGASPLFSGTAAAATIITVEGGGADIWSTADAFHFYYAQVSGDFDVTVHNSRLEDTDEFAKGGIMARETLDADAKNVMLRHIPANVSALQWRSETGGSTISTTSGGTEFADVEGGNVEGDWLRLRRSGDTIEAFASDDGGSWTRIGHLPAAEVGLSDEVYLGLPVTSHDTGTLCTAEYRNLSGVSPTANQDVGDVEVSGSVSVATGVPVVSVGEATDVSATSATLHGSLSDLGEAGSAEVYFEYREADADSWVTTSVETLTATGSFSAAATDLAPQQGYEYRAVADTADGDSATSGTRTFETPSVVTMESVDDVTANSASFTGSASLVGLSSAEVHFEYRELNTDSWTETGAQTLDSSGSFDAEASGLPSRRYVEVRAAMRGDGIDEVTSQTLQFSTPSTAEGSTPRTGPSSASQFDIEDGFATAAEWLDDDTPVVKVREPTREQLVTALDVEGERLIVFETSGSIDLDGGFSITNGKFYLAGQTAPSPGVTLNRGGILVEAEDFVVQHVRIRRGDDTPDAGAGDSLGTSETPTNGVFDHVTASWGTDETLSCYGTDMTISNCIVSEALRNSEFHSGGNGHSAGSLIGSGYERIAMMGNVWASNLTRNPRLQSGTSVVVNNVSYDFRNAAGCSTDTTSSIVANAFIRGDVDNPAIFMMDPHNGSIYADGNYTVPDAQPVVGDGVNRASSRPVWPEGLEALPAEETKSHALNNAGARPADRTYHDRRIIHNVANWEPIGDHLPGPSGLDHAWIDHEELVGGYPDLPVNTAEVDVPESGTWPWIKAKAREVEEHDERTYEDDPGPGLVDDFEDGDLSEYVGALGDYGVTADAPVASGRYSMKNTSGSDAMISSWVDLPRYPQAGDTFSAKVAGTDETGVMGVAFAIASYENFYFLRYWPGSETVQFYKVTETEYSEPTYTKLAESDPVALDTGATHEYVVDWGIDGQISVELRDASAERVASLSANDSTHLFGGIGTRRSGMLDEIRVLETATGGPGGAESHQVDFVAGGVEESLGESGDDYYGRQNRLIQYAHTEGDEVTERDTWINSLDGAVRDCVNAGPIEVADGAASATFTVAEGCERELSLAAYTLPGGGFSFDSADEQELVDSATRTFGPGEHTLRVELADPE